jgi:hypothetical protein
MLDWVAVRHGIKVKEIWQVEAESMIQIPRANIDNASITKFKEYKEPPSIATPWVNPNQYRKPDTKGVVSYSLSGADFEKVGIKKDALISFNPLAVFLPKSKSKAGVVEGYMHESPWFMVRASGVDIRKIFNPKQKPLIGEALGILNADSVNPILVLRNITVDDNANVVVKSSPKTIIRNVGIMDKDLWPEGSKGNKGTNVVDIKGQAIREEPQTIIKNINGPAGRLISFKDYETLTKHGCAFCQGDLPLADAGRLTWVQDAPVCPTCANETSGNRLN